MHKDALQPLIITEVVTDRRGFARIAGMCIGRRVRVDGITYFEVKDRNRNRSISRGAQLLRVPLKRFLADLAE